MENGSWIFTPLSGKEDRRPIHRKRLTECYFRYMSQLLIRQSAPHLIETVNLKFDLDIQLAIVSRPRTPTQGQSLFRPL